MTNQIPKENDHTSNYQQNKPLEEENTAEMIDSRKKYLQKKICSAISPPAKENTCLVLLTIVLLFVLTHSFRLALKIYEILLPGGNTSKHYEQCFSVGR